MADSTTHLNTITSGQQSKEATANGLIDALSPAATGGRHDTATSLLTWGYYAGVVTLDDGSLFQLASGTKTLTDDATNYIELDPSDGSVDLNTSGWSADKIRLYSVVVASGAVTGYTDWRVSGLGSKKATAIEVVDAGGYFTGTKVEDALQELGADVAVLTSTLDADTDQKYTSDTDSVADSDPGAGLFKWDNATQASATALYVDDVTAAAVNMATFFASLPPDGYIHLVQDDDPTKWQVWKWSGLPTAGTGYYKFTGLTLLANGGAIADAKSVSISFKGTVPASYPVVVGFGPFPGSPEANQLMFMFPAPADIPLISFAAAIAGSAGKSLGAATAQADLDVRKNATAYDNGTSVGTVRFAAAATVPSFIAASPFSLTGGSDWLTVWGPGTPDATLSDISVALYGTR